MQEISPALESGKFLVDSSLEGAERGRRCLENFQAVEHQEIWRAAHAESLFNLSSIAPWSDIQVTKVTAGLEIGF